MREAEAAKDTNYRKIAGDNDKLPSIMSRCSPRLACLLRTVAEFVPLAAAFCPPRILVTQFASLGMSVDIPGH